MLIKAIKQYKFWALGSLAMVILVVGTTLWQPQILTKVLVAVSNDDKEKITNYGIQLIVIAGIGLLAGVVNTIFAFTSFSFIHSRKHGPVENNDQLERDCENVIQAYPIAERFPIHLLTAASIFVSVKS